MLRRVRLWEPPTSAHVNLRNMMAEQIEESISHDCSDGVVHSNQMTTAPRRWKAERIASLKKDLDYHIRKDEEERLRTDGWNAWLLALRKCVKQPRKK